MSNIRYRKDIDGLRALAVIAVVLFHLDINWVKSGYLGVDIFFVISGYLITSIIIRDLDSGSFSIKNFYLRRMRRILPALIFILITSTIFAWIILVPDDLKNYSASMLAAISSVANIFFFYTLNFGYWSTDASIIPLLHTWSLGVEEQFYIFWPIILILIFKNNLKNKLPIIALILFVISITLFFTLTEQKYYYSPITRAFELLFGCILATSKKPNINNPIYLNIVSVFAFILMIIPTFMFDSIYPSFSNVLVCFGAAVFIYIGMNNTYLPIINKIFSTRPIVAIGLISYSLYLWHWPIIAFVNYLNIDKTFSVDAIIIITSIILSIVSYFLVEKPFRSKFKFSFSKTFIFIFIIPVIIFIINMVASSFAVSQNYRISSLDKRLINSLKDTNVSTFYCENSIFNDNGTINIQKLHECSQNKPIDVILFGDSHARSDTQMIRTWTSNLDLSLLEIDETGGFMFEKVYNKNLSSDVLSIINQLHPKAFIFANFWNMYFTNSYSYSESFNDAIKTLVQYNVTPVIILDYPSLFEKKPTCGNYDNKGCYTSLQKVLDNQKTAIETITALKRKYPTLKIIDPKKALCIDNQCSNMIDGKFIYMNNDNGNSHLNFYGSRIAGERYLKMYENPLTDIIKYS